MWDSSEKPGRGVVHYGDWIDLYAREWGARAYRGFSHSEWIALRAALLAEPGPGALQAAREALISHRQSHPPQPSTLLPSSLSCNDHQWHILETLVATLERIEKASLVRAEVTP